MNRSFDDRHDPVDGVRAMLDTLQFMAAGGIVGVAVLGILGLKGPLLHDALAACIGAAVVFVLRRTG